jgi:hypothetical protein
MSFDGMEQLSPLTLAGIGLQQRPYLVAEQVQQAVFEGF